MTTESRYWTHRFEKGEWIRSAGWGDNLAVAIRQMAGAVEAQPEGGRARVFDTLKEKPVCEVTWEARKD